MRQDPARNCVVAQGSCILTVLIPEHGESEGTVEGFTLVLIIAWLILLATFGGMYFMDQASKKASEKQSGEAPVRAAKG